MLKVILMKNIFGLLLVITAVLQTSLVQADSFRGDNYWIVGVDQLTFGEDGTFGADELSMPSMNFAFGHRFNRFLSAEVNMSWWMINHHIASDELSSGTEILMDKAQGVSLRLDFPLYKRLGGFSQISYNLVHVTIVGSGNFHDDGLGYSGGLEYKLKRGAVFARYAVILDNENDDPAEPSLEDFTALGLGYKMDLPF
jgi:hypothetical protein